MPSARLVNELPPVELKCGWKLTVTLQAHPRRRKFWPNPDRRNSGPCGIRQTVSSNRESGRKKAHLFWVHAFATCTSKTCVRIQRGGNPPSLAMEISLCPKFD